MGLRLTGLATYYLFTNSLTKRNFEMFRTSEQMSSMKRINRPSDDPEGTKVMLGFKVSMSQLEQYQKNLDVADRHLQQTESSLTQVKDILVRAKELAIQGKNGTMSADARAALAEEVQQLQQQMLSAANTNINGEYVFSGYKTDTLPYALSALQPNATPVATYSGDTNVRAVQISEGSTMAIQVRGDQVFQGDGTAAQVDLFQSMADLESALRSNNIDDDDAHSVGSMIDDLDKGLTQVLGHITSVGAKLNRIESTKAEYSSQIDNFKVFTENIEGADVAQLASEFQRANTALQATIQAAGLVMKMPSLMEFIGN